MAPNYNILIVDDEDKIRWSIRNFINEENFVFHEAENGEVALRILNTTYIDIVLLDILLPDRNGLDILKEIKSRYYWTQVIIITAYANIQDVVEAVRHGAADYIQKPFSLEDLKIKIYKAIEQDTIQNSLASILRVNRRHEPGGVSLIANDPKMFGMLEYAEQLAMKDVDCILITGETGTGKGEIANYIYQQNTRRKTGPFLTVNCNSLTSSLMDAELFGYEKGAFTDAKGKKDGLFKAANTGIIFLDEIGDIHPELQGKLLRVIEKKIARRIGGIEDEQLDVMVILATNKNLKSQVAKGFFRSDLYFRVNAFEISIPPLRERKGDILPLAYFFIEKYNHRFNKKFTRINKEVEDEFQNNPWPGNVRELKNVIEHIVLLGQGNEIRKDMLNEKSSSGERDSHALQENIRENIFKDLDSLEKFYLRTKINIIRKVLNECNGNISKAAEKLKMDRSTLNYSIKKFRGGTGIAT